MKKSLSVLVMILLVGFSGLSAGIYTADDYKTALSQAGEKNQNIMITFYTEW